MHPAWLALFLGLWFAHERLSPEPQAQWPLGVGLLILLGFDLLLRHVLAGQYPWVEPVLADPLRGVAQLFSLLLALASWSPSSGGRRSRASQFLALAVAVQLGQAALGVRSTGAGACLVGLAYVVLLAVSAPGPGPLSRRLGVDAGLSETLALIVVVQVVQLLLELAPGAYAWSRPVVRPAQVLAAGLVFALGLFATLDPVLGPLLSLPQQWAVLAGAALTARANASGFLGLMATALLYLCVHGPGLAALTPTERMAYLLEPLRLALYAFVVAIGAVLGEELGSRTPGLLAGPNPLGFLASPARPWLHAAAVFASLVAAGRHAASETLRHRPTSSPPLGSPPPPRSSWAGSPARIFSIGWRSRSPASATYTPSGSSGASRCAEAASPTSIWSPSASA